MREIETKAVAFSCPQSRESITVLMGIHIPTRLPLTPSTNGFDKLRLLVDHYLSKEIGENMVLLKQ